MSILGLTPRSAAYHRNRRRKPRVDLDPTLVRYFIYRLHDAEGRILYIGRSCDVPARLRAHHREANPSGHKAWFFRSRRVSLVGPFDWNEACRVERREIEAHQPVGNRMFTKAHGYRPLAEGGGQYIGRQPPPT